MKVLGYNIHNFYGNFQIKHPHSVRLNVDKHKSTKES